MVTPSPPATLLGYQQARLARLELAVGALSLSVLLLVGIGAWYALHGLPVHYIPPGGPGLSQPGVIPDAVATDYASRWLRSRYTFTPATVKTAHADVLAALHPSLIVAFKAQAEREALVVKEAQLSTQTAISTAAVTRRTPQEVTVSLDARRTIWIGGQQVRDEPIQADITVVPWLSQGHPAGLVVARVVISPALSASGP
jgi:hypothetical protein